MWIQFTQTYIDMHRHVHTYHTYIYGQHNDVGNNNGYTNNTHICMLHMYACMCFIAAYYDTHACTIRVYIIIYRERDIVQEREREM